MSGRCGMLERLPVRTLDGADSLGGAAAAGRIVYTDPVGVETTKENLTYVDTVGANAIRLWNTSGVDTTNYERIALRWAGNDAFLVTEQGGTGTARNLYIGATGAGTVSLYTQSGVRWTVNTSGHFMAGTDNVYDIGASGATRPRNIYAGTQFLAPTAVVGQPTYSFQGVTTTGMWWVPGNSTIAFTIAGSHYLGVRSTNLNIGTAMAFTWSSDVGTGGDLQLHRDAAAVLALKNGTTAQEFRVYGTTTGPAYASIGHNGTIAQIKSTVNGIGLYPSGTSNLLYYVKGTANFNFASGVALGWTSSATDASITEDTALVRDGAAGVLAQRAGTQAQEFRVYNTYTSATNNELLKVGWGLFGANTAHIATDKGSGGGSARAMFVGTVGTAALSLVTTAQEVARFTAQGSCTLTPYNENANHFTCTLPADTGLTASTERVGVVWGATPAGGTYVRTWDAGNFALQREHYVQAPTYAITGGASTIDDAVTWAVSGPPVASGSPATIITRKWIATFGALEATVAAPTAGVGVFNAGNVDFVLRDTTNNIEFGAQIVSGDGNGYWGMRTNHALIFKTNDTSRWQINTSGHFLPVTNQAYDIGSASFAILNIHAYTETLYTAGACLVFGNDGSVAQSITIGTTNGLKIGNATTQKIGLWNATPIVQPAGIADADGTLADITTKFNSLLGKLESFGFLAVA